MKRGRLQVRKDTFDDSSMSPAEEQLPERHEEAVADIDEVTETAGILSISEASGRG